MLPFQILAMINDVEEIKAITCRFSALCYLSAYYTYTVWFVLCLTFFSSNMGTSHQILHGIINRHNPSYKKGQGSSDIVWKMDKMILLGYSLFFINSMYKSESCDIFKKSTRIDLLRMLFPTSPWKKLSASDLKYYGDWGFRNSNKPRVNRLVCSSYSFCYYILTLNIYIYITLNIWCFYLQHFSILVS